MKKLFSLGLFIMAICTMSFNASALCLVSGEYRTANGDVSRIVLGNNGTYFTQSVVVADGLLPVFKTETTGTYKVYPGCFGILTKDSKDDEHHDKSDKPKALLVTFSDLTKLPSGRSVANVGLSDKFTMVRTFRK